MPPPIKRDECVIVFDLNVSPEFFVKAKQCLIDIYSEKWYTDSKDNVCLLPFGEKVMQCDCLFDHYDPSILKTINTAGIQANDGRVLRILLQAAKLLEKRHNHSTLSKGVYTRQVLFISDFTNSKFQGDDDIFKQLVKKLNDMRAFLYILGPEVVHNEMLMNWQELHTWIQEPNFKIDQKSNEYITYVKQLIENVNRSVVCDLTIGTYLFGYIKKWAGPQPCIIPLVVGENKICFTNHDQRTLKKFSFTKFECDSIYNDFSNWKYVLAENPEIEVNYENLIRAICVSGMYITLPQDVRDAFKNKGDRYFQVLGFVKEVNISPHLYVGDGTHQTVPAGLHKDWTTALLRVLKEKQMVCIAAKRVIKNCKPKFWILKPSDQYKWFYAIELPYGNRIKQNHVETRNTQDLLMELNAKHEEQQQETGIYNYLDSMQLTASDLPLNLNMRNHPCFRKWWRFAVKKQFEIESCDYAEEFLGKMVSDQPLLDFWLERDEYEIE